jgi:hypothetical protein
MKSLDMQGQLLFSVFHEKMWKFLACEYPLCNYNYCFCVGHLWDEQPKVLEIKTFIYLFKIPECFLCENKMWNCLDCAHSGFTVICSCRISAICPELFLFSAWSEKQKEAGLLGGRNGWRRWWCGSPLHSLIKQEVQHGGRVLIWKALT